MRNGIYAGIVSYNPDLDKLRENINAIYTQVEKVVIDDNGSENVLAVETLCENYPNVTVLKNDTNLGIGAALNVLFRYADRNNIEWLLTLDQDSCVYGAYIEECRVFLNDPEVVSLSTLREDRNCEENMDYDTGKLLQEIPFCITSGNLVRIEIWKKVGGFNESMFIDDVDIEFCYKIRENGYKIHQLNKCLLTHELGEAVNIRVFGRDIVNRNHSPFRKYYIFRNLVYMKKFVPVSYGEINWNWRIFAGLSRIILFENCKFAKLKAAFKGLRDGRKMQEYDRSNVIDSVVAKTSEGGVILLYNRVHYIFKLSAYCASEKEALCA